MRRILVDSVRARGAIKRGGHAGLADLNPDELPAPESVRARELIELDEALTRLSQMDPRRARVVELHVFGSLTTDYGGNRGGSWPVTAERAARLETGQGVAAAGDVRRQWRLNYGWES